MKKSTKKSIALVAIAVVICTCLGWLTAGFQSFDIGSRFERERNPENLIDAENISLATARHESGIDITVDDNGVVTLNGESDEDVTLTYAVVALEPGDYILTGAEDGSKSTYYLSVTVGSEVIKGDFNGEFTVSTAGSYTIQIHIKGETALKNVKLYPIVNEGSEAVNFYK